MDRCVSIEDVKSFIEIIAIIVTLIIAIIGALRYMSYLTQKRIDAACGFYAKLRWDLLSLKKLLVSSKNKSNSVLYNFSESFSNKGDLKLPGWEKELFGNLYTNIFEKLHNSDNQISTSIQNKLDIFNEEFENYSNIGLNHRWTKNDNKVDEDFIDEKTNLLVCLVDDVLIEIQKFQNDKHDECTINCENANFSIEIANLKEQLSTIKSAYDNYNTTASALISELEKFQLPEDVDDDSI